VFWLNQLMGFIFALFSSCNKGPHANWRTSLLKIKWTFAESLSMNFGSLNFSYNQQLSSGLLLSWVDH